MATLTERTTVYLNPYVKKYLQHEAVEQNKSISELINEQLAELLEDAEDSAAINSRKTESLTSWDKVKADLVRDGLL
ncbi:CopG family transcriptional regulator [Candidatus Saccharibacteria bacterium]|nr:CopG family transcriptional regulator [Candidatus Saccharibacteria bacterium]